VTSPSPRKHLAAYVAATAVVGACASALTLPFAACADADRNTEARSGPNGCLGDACFDAAPKQPQPGADGATPDGGPSFPDPLEGTTKTATLVKGGFQFTEGPVWIGGRLIFSDTNANAIHELLEDGGGSRLRSEAGAPNGNAVDQAGRLVTCEGANHRVVKSDAKKGAGTTSIASTFGGEPFNAPNDVVVRASDGNVYFTDPNYGSDPDTQDAEAVYRLAPGGGLSRLDHEFQKPNGVALSPDGATLYVVDNGAGELWAAPLGSDGALGGAFAKVADTPGGDGMAVDDAGNLYVADTDGVDVFDRTGTKLGSIAVAEQPANCTFGGADRRTLYVTARKGVYAIKTNVPGLP
jgi:gluconolactonase